MIKNNIKHKAFTLAEIILVIVVIGVIAAITLSVLAPSMDDGRYRVAYRKAYTAIRNMYDAERYTGMMGSIAADKGLMFKMLKKNLQVKDYAIYKDDSSTYGHSDYIDIKDLPMDESAYDYWIVAQDNIAYRINSQGDYCKPRAVINSTTTFQQAIYASCFTILVDVNGLSKGPNVIAPQNVEPNEPTGILKADRFYIYMGLDGSTAGNVSDFTTGRIIAGMK